MPYKNREIQLQHQQDHYRKNKSVYSIRFKTRRLARREYAQSIKMEVGCQVCGYKKCKSSLVFHHKYQIKDSTPAYWYRHGWSFERIDKDMKGCIVLCSNCHLEHHEGIINADSISSDPILNSKTYTTWDKTIEYTKEHIEMVALVENESTLDRF